jgi:hypothetical protein
MVCVIEMKVVPTASVDWGVGEDDRDRCLSGGKVGIHRRRATKSCVKNNNAGSAQLGQMLTSGGRIAEVGLGNMLAGKADGGHTSPDRRASQVAPDGCYRRRLALLHR